MEEHRRKIMLLLRDTEWTSEHIGPVEKRRTQQVQKEMSILHSLQNSTDKIDQPRRRRKNRLRRRTDPTNTTDTANTKKTGAYIKTEINPYQPSDAKNQIHCFFFNDNLLVG